MAKGIQAYNAAIAAIRKSTGVSQKEAQQTYRSASVRLGHAPKASDIPRSRIIREESGRAGTQIRAKEREREKRIERISERAREPERRRLERTRDTRPVEVGPPPRRGPKPFPGGGDRGGGGGGRTKEVRERDFDYEDSGYPEEDFSYDDEGEY